MSVTNSNIDEKLNNDVAPVREPGTLDKILKERDSRKPVSELDEDIESGVKETKDIKINKEPKTIEKIVENKKKIEEKLAESENKESKNNPVESGEDEDRELELGKLRKALNDSQKWGHTNNKRLKSVVKIVSSLKEQGILNDDEFSNLNNLLSSDVEEPEADIQNISIDPVSNLIQIANKRVPDLAEIYEDDKLFNKKVEAFDFCINHASEKEKDDILEDLEKFKESPLKLAKRMYQIGEKYYNENYKELEEAGGLKELVSLKNSEIERMKKKIDKLERNLLQYSDYDKPISKIDELGDTATENMSTNEPGNVLGSLMKKRDSKKR